MNAPSSWRVLASEGIERFTIARLALGDGQAYKALDAACECLDNNGGGPGLLCVGDALGQRYDVAGPPVGAYAAFAVDVLSGWDATHSSKASTV